MDQNHERKSILSEPSRAFELPASSRRRFLACLAGMAGVSLTEAGCDAQPSQPAHGRFTDTDALKDIFVSKGAGAKIAFPTGRRVSDDTLHIAPGTSITGAGMDRTILRITNRRDARTLYGLRCTSGLRISDLTIELEDIAATYGEGPTWVAALGFIDAARGMRFERVRFVGVGQAKGAMTGFIENADVHDVTFADCRFDMLEIASALKANSDHSTQTGWNWQRCKGTRCIDGLNINSPSGEWSHGSVTDCDFSGCMQFPFAFAGPKCSDWIVDVTGRDNAYECVHIEDGVNGLHLKLAADRCNLQPGVAGSPKASNGAVQVIGGAHNLKIDISVNLQQSGAVGRAGLVLQAGGPRVSDGRTVAPFDIGIGGHIVLGRDSVAIIGYDVDLHFDDLEIFGMSPQPSDHPMMSLSGCRWTGNLTVGNPGTLVAIDPHNCLLGAWDELRLIGNGNGFPELRWITGLSPATRNAAPLARKIRFDFSPSCAHSPIILCPAPASFDGEVAVAVRRDRLGISDATMHGAGSNWHIANGWLAFAPSALSPCGAPATLTLNGPFVPRN